MQTYTLVVLHVQTPVRRSTFRFRLASAPVCPRPGNSCSSCSRHLGLITLLPGATNSAHLAQIGQLKAGPHSSDLRSSGGVRTAWSPYCLIHVERCQSGTCGRLAVHRSAPNLLELRHLPAIFPSPRVRNSSQNCWSYRPCTHLYDPNSALSPDSCHASGRLV